MKVVKNDSKIFLGNNIRCLRKRMSLSQEELAFKIGLNRGNIASYEKGIAEPKICNLLKFSNFFGVSILDLTKRDLQPEDNFQKAKAHENGLQISHLEMPILNEFTNRAQELKEVLESLHCYHCFKMKTLEELPKDMQMVIINFEKLFEVTQVLMDSHQELIEFIKKKCPRNE